MTFGVRPRRTVALVAALGALGLGGVSLGGVALAAPASAGRAKTSWR